MPGARMSQPAPSFFATVPVETLPQRGSVFADFVQAAYAGRKPALTWREIVQANEWTLAADEASRIGGVVKIKA